MSKIGEDLNGWQLRIEEAELAAATAAQVSPADAELREAMTTAVRVEVSRRLPTLTADDCDIAARTTVEVIHRMLTERA